MFSLFPHNEEAYKSAKTMLAETGKAAVIHPTGTGKSFIGFKFVQDDPDRKVLWLGPSQYIFRTQLENIRETGASYPANAEFMTYAKLAYLTEDEIRAINTDLIILDEFHRCGAEQWGRGVNTLLCTHTDVPVLGLSATNIRYLDNQRDMADEIFEDNVASEMTLGAAIARGILTAPKYVTGVYSIKNALKNVEYRVRNAKSKEVRDSAQKYLDALKKALDKADGLEVIFDRHLTEREGKYLIFCSDVEHLRLVEKSLPQWMSMVDSDPHIYTAYSDNPTTARNFAEFKLDRSRHLKLLCCVDMLNEGIHVTDVNGVILCRPTVSPIVYKQQIGRALSASKKSGTPVIFDLVDNFDSLYTIDALQKEMKEAADFYDRYQQGPPIVTTRFELTDEVRDCRELFGQLNDALTASWDLMYAHAKAWYDDHHTLKMPKGYTTPDGYKLQQWLGVQKRVRAGKIYGTLTPERIAKLDALGMLWEKTSDVLWEKNMEAARRYHSEHGDLDMPAKYVTPDGLKLGAWICNLRQTMNNPVRKSLLTEDKIEALNALGMIWDKLDYTQDRYYSACVEYHQVHRNIDIPRGYCTEEGLRLGEWLHRARMIYAGKIPSARPFEPEFIENMNRLGMNWLNAYDSAWEEGFRHATAYREQYGHIKVPHNFKCEDGYPLGAWLYRHFNVKDSRGRTSIKVTEERRQKLTALGVVFDQEKIDPWEYRFALVKKYYEEHGSLVIPASVNVEGVNLAKWISDQRVMYHGRRKGKPLTQEQISRLEAIGMVWDKADEAWNRIYEKLHELFQAHGNLNIPSDHPEAHKLSVWMNKQKKNREHLSLSQMEKLNALGFDWLLVKDRALENNYAEALRYHEEHGNLDVTVNTVTDTGFNLGQWIANLRYAKKKGKLSDEQIQKLEALGIKWSMRKAK